MVSVSGKPFVVVTDSIRHYFGAVWPMISSGNFDGPIIDVGPRFYPLDIIKYQCTTPIKEKTPGITIPLNRFLMIITFYMLEFLAP